MKCTLVLEAESPSEMQTLLQKLSGSLQVEKTVAGALPEIHSPEPETRRCKYCGAPISGPARKAICGSEACKKTAAREYARAYAAKKKAVVMPAEPEDPLAVENLS